MSVATKKGHDLLVKVRGVWMNKYCRAQKDHPPREAKHCPYCRVCAHGCTEYMHCDKCNTDQSWRDKPITDAEIEEVLKFLLTCAPGYLRRHSGRKRDFRDGPSLIPLAVAKLRILLRSRQ